MKTGTVTLIAKSSKPKDIKAMYEMQNIIRLNCFHDGIFLKTDYYIGKPFLKMEMEVK